MAASSQLARPTALHRPSVYFQAGSKSRQANYAIACPSCAASLSRDLKKQRRGIERYEGGAFLGAPSKRQTRMPCAATATDQHTVSNTAVLDPKTLKEKRKFMDWTQPWFSRETVLAEEAEGIWTLTQPFQLGFGRFADARLRATVVRLEDGSLWVHSPVALTEECLELVETQFGGPVSHIVIPNTSPEHRWYSKGWAEKFPEAKWYAPGVVTQKLSQKIGKNVQALEANKVPAAWGNVFQSVTFSAGAKGGFEETLFLHEQEKALIVADLLLYLDDDQLPTALNKMMTQKLGCYKQLGMLPPFRLALGNHPEAAKAYIEALLKLDFSFIIFSHGTASAKATKEDVRRVYQDYL